MPYTLMKGLGWFALALVIGLVVGWLLRSIIAKRQIARARRHHVDNAELEHLRGRVANLEPVVEERDRLLAELEALRGAVPPGAGPALAGYSCPTQVPSVPDVAAAAKVLGTTVTIDDLKVIDGIGPSVEELCHGIGIRTWLDLSTTEVSLLRTMLVDAGSRFATLDPSTWPEQARLLAEGRWDEFKALTSEVARARAVGDEA
jgi:predicted flap endonuclease-1-like 5' DNA nuclease